MAFGCSSGYDTHSEKVCTFSFPLGKFDLIEKLIKCVNRNNCFPMKNSVLCLKYFEDKYILKGEKNKLNWNLQPMPTKLSEKIKILPTQTDFRKPPKQRQIENMNDKIFFQLTL